MSCWDVLSLQARIERIANAADRYLPGFYAATATSALCLIILPAIAGAIGRTLS